MSAVKPRIAVVFHTKLLPEIQKGVLECICKTYFGPLTIGTDVMVWNVTKERITMREADFPDRLTPPPTTKSYRKAPRSGIANMSDYVIGSIWEVFTPTSLPAE